MKRSEYDRGMGMGSQIRAVREAAGLSLGRLAVEAKVSKGYLSLLENGRNDAPSAAILFRLSAVLGIPVEQLVSATDYPSRLVAHARNRGWTPAETRMVATVVVDGAGVDGEEEWDAAFEAIAEIVKSRRASGAANKEEEVGA